MVVPQTFSFSFLSWSCLYIYIYINLFVLHANITDAFKHYDTTNYLTTMTVKYYKNYIERWAFEFMVGKKKHNNSNNLFI